MTLFFVSASISAQSTDLDKKLFAALRKGNTAGIQVLLDQGAHVNARDGANGVTPLVEAAAHTDLPTVKLLLQRGADVNAHAADDEEPLSAALIGPSSVLVPEAVIATVQLLIDHGADVQFAGTRGKTPLMWATGRESLLPALTLLLGKGARSDTRDDAGDTALAWSAKNLQPPAMSALLAHGAQVNTRNNKGITPLMIAARTGNLPIIKLLLTHGADPNVKDNTGQTAADYARTERDLRPATRTKVLTLLQANRSK
ncbi:ankyrin repeat domain-containing protein [Terriglobus sp.]|uniref:ankyrin repeat domain-containing protein n=1 Tax=Terriglobus sp. TaxID=1889013 RepID=UPI003B00982C